MQTAQSLSETEEARAMRRAYLGALPFAVVGIGVAVVMTVVERLRGKDPSAPRTGRMR